MNASTGREMDEIAHIQQSIRDILTTRIGTRVMRRHYGSIVPELLDQPSNQATQLRLMAASVMAIILWEPRVMVTQTQFSFDMAGSGILDIQGVRRDGQRSGETVSLSVQVA